MPRRTRTVLGAGALAAATAMSFGTASAQDAPTTTTTLKLEIGSPDTTAAATPNRVDAGGGGTAETAGIPLQLTALAAGLVGVTALAARRARTVS